MRGTDNFTMTQWGEGLLVVFFGIMLSSGMVAHNKPLDSVSIYQFTHVFPEKNALNDAISRNQGALPPVIATAARATIDPECKITYIQSRSYRQVIVDSPVCECLDAVLTKYASNTASTANTDNAKKAFTACFKTQALIPKTKDAFNTSETSSDAESGSRKLISRSALVWTLLLSVLFHLVYNSIQFSDTQAYVGSSNIIQRAFLAGIVVAQWLLPLIASTTDKQSRKITMFHLMLILPAALEFLFIDYFWSYIYNYKRKTAFIHPYVFHTTFLALMLVAMVENGVFNYHVIFSHFLTAHALTFAYAAVLFFQHYGCNRDPPDGSESDPLQAKDPRTIDYTTVSGYIIVCAASAALIVSNIVPYYPVSSALNPTWMLPWLFAGSAFLIPIFIEHLMDGVGAESKLDWMAHAGFRIYLSIVVLAFIFYTSRLWHLYFGETIPTSMGLPSDTLNYGIKSRNSDSTMFFIG